VNGWDARGRVRDVAFFAFLAGYTILAVFILALGVVAAIANGSPELHRSLHLIGLDASTFTERLAQATATASHQTESLGQLVLDYGFSILNLVLGLYLVWLRPHNRTARLLAIGMVGTAAVFNLQALSVYGALQTTPFETGVHFGFELIAMLAYCYALLTFPDGHLIPRWPAWARALLYVPITAGIAVVLWTVQGTPLRAAIILAFGLLVPTVGVIAQAYRWRWPNTQEERQLSRLLFFALLPALIVSQLGHSQNLSDVLVQALPGRAVHEVPVEFFRLFQPVFLIITIALFAGIIRFRIWDIDRIVSRTIVYGALAGFVSAVYIGVVVGVGNVIGTQQHSLLLSLLATGLVAIAFQPVRDRVQQLANRLVYGNRATPYEVLSSFSRMAESFGAEDLLSRTAHILFEGTDATVIVWLRVGEELRPAASWPQVTSEPGQTVRMDGEELPVFQGADRAVPVRYQGELLGAITIKKRGEALTAAEDKLVSDLAGQAGLVLRNARLTAELLERLEDLRNSRQRLVRAQDEARRRLERNIHDGAQQQLVALKVKLSLAERLVDKDPARLKQALTQLKLDTDEAIQALRELARGIYPPLLAEGGLAVALESQARKSSVPVEVEAGPVDRYAPELESAVYFCALEALQNVAKSAEAKRAVIRLATRDGVLIFAIEDDGKGFDPQQAHKGSGLQNMKDRIEALGGKLSIRSAHGLGTCVSGEVPAAPRPVATAGGTP
jgi:signal transduction histidine kinase